MSSIIAATDASFKTVIATIPCEEYNPAFVRCQIDLLGGQLANLYCTTVYTYTDAHGLSADLKVQRHQPSRRFPFPDASPGRYDAKDESANDSSYGGFKILIVTLQNKYTWMSILVGAWGKNDAMDAAADYLERVGNFDFFLSDTVLAAIADQHEQGDWSVDYKVIGDKCHGILSDNISVEVVCLPL